MRALSEEKAREAKQELIAAREDEALSELRKLGFRVTLHELPHYVEDDILAGTHAGWKTGTCYAVIYDRAGKRKHISGVSAVDALVQAQSWSRWQEGLKDDAANKFHPTSFDVPEVGVSNRVAGDTAETKQRRENASLRVLSFQSGTAEIVHAHGAPIEETHASQFPTSDQKETTR